MHLTSTKDWIIVSGDDGVGGWKLLLFLLSVAVAVVAVASCRGAECPYSEGGRVVRTRRRGDHDEYVVLILLLIFLFLPSSVLDLGFYLL